MALQAMQVSSLAGCGETRVAQPLLAVRRGQVQQSAQAGVPVPLSNPRRLFRSPVLSITEYSDEQGPSPGASRHPLPLGEG